MFQKMLIPLDGTELAEGILPYVSQLARGFDIPIVLLSVVDPDAVRMPERLIAKHEDEEPREGIRSLTTFEGASPSPASGTSGCRGVSLRHETGGPYASQIFERVEVEVKRELDAVINRLNKAGVKAESVVSFGKPAEEIVRVAEREGCDLIAMSTHGRNALGRGILGSVTDKIIHSSNLPTLTITPERAEEYRENAAAISRILVPLDGSKAAESALPYVEQLARKLGLEIVLVRVVNVVSGFAPYMDGYPYENYSDMESDIKSEAVKYLEGIAERLNAKGLKVEWKVLAGATAPSIIGLAKETSQDIIALTTRGRSGITRWIMGSVAEALVRASGDPVLVIPPGKVSLD